MSNKQSFEKAMAQLEGLVSKLESGNMPLDEAMQAFETGSKLVLACQKQLDEAELKVEKILSQDEDGNVKVSEFSPE